MLKMIKLKRSVCGKMMYKREKKIPTKRRHDWWSGVVWVDRLMQKMHACVGKKDMHDQWGGIIYINAKSNLWAHAWFLDATQFWSEGYK